MGFAEPININSRNSIMWNLPRNTNKVYKDGDEIIITEELNKRLVEKLDKLFDRDYPVGMRGVCYAKRFDRDTGWLCIEWDSGKHTNAHFLKEIGLNFEQPSFKKLDLMECPIELLSPSELVLRGIIEYGYTERAAESIFEDLEHVMNKLEIVFYQP
jgi:hypothetical protein